jgi:cytidylate kinase
MAETIITIGREFGSGGAETGRKLADKLGIPFYDKELITLAAQKTGLNERYLEAHDEKPANPLSFALNAGMYLGSVQPVNQSLLKAQFDTIRQLASRGSCVLVGRCADYILKDDPRLFSCFICAPLEQRVERIAQLHDLSHEAAEELVRKTDKQRASYYNFYSPSNWGRAANYDLCVNSKSGVNQAVSLILEALRLRGLKK